MSWRSEQGQASVEFMGMLFWLLVATVVVWQLMLAAWTANQATNAARTASRVSARPDGDPEKAARSGPASTTSARAATGRPSTCGSRSCCRD